MLINMAGAVLVLVLSLGTQAVLASSSPTGVHLDLRVDGSVPTKKMDVFPLPYNIGTDRSQLTPDNGVYILPGVSKASFNSRKQKSNHHIHKMKYPAQVKENKELPHLEQVDEYTATSYVAHDMAADLNPKIIITSSNSDDISQVKTKVEEAKTAGEFIMQSFASGMEMLYLRQKLQKLDFYFNFHGIVHEDCRQRILCEVLKEPRRFYPFSGVLEDATSFYDNFPSVNLDLANTTEGIRLLSYMEAVLRAQEGGQSCGVFQYRCPFPTEDMINYDSLCLWSEMVRWLTIHVVARKSPRDLQPLPIGAFTPWA